MHSLVCLQHRMIIQTVLSRMSEVLQKPPCAAGMVQWETVHAGLEFEEAMHINNYVRRSAGNLYCMSLLKYNVKGNGSLTVVKQGNKFRFLGFTGRLTTGKCGHRLQDSLAESLF